MKLIFPIAIVVFLLGCTNNSQDRSIASSSNLAKTNIVLILIALHSAAAVYVPMVKPEPAGLM